MLPNRHDFPSRPPKLSLHLRISPNVLEDFLIPVLRTSTGTPIATFAPMPEATVNHYDQLRVFKDEIGRTWKSAILHFPTTQAGPYNRSPESAFRGCIATRLNRGHYSGALRSSDRVHSLTTESLSTTYCSQFL